MGHAVMHSRRFLAFLLILAVTLAAADAPRKARKADSAAKTPARWEATIQKFEAADITQPPPKGSVLLVGGSNARRWADVADYFPGQTVLNRGFGGAHLADILHFADRIVLPYEPRVIFLNAGGNDLSSGRSPEEVRDACRALVRKVGSALPGTRIISISLPPVLRAANSPQGMSVIKKTNALLSALADEEPALEFVDLFPAFAGANGRTRAELFVEDGTHFSAAGYAIVAGLLKPKL